MSEDGPSVIVPMVSEIRDEVCDYFGVSIIDILSDRRSRVIARPRQIIMYLAKEMTFRSLPEIGKAIGGRDHTTIMHGISRIKDLLPCDPELQADLEQIRIGLRQRVLERPVVAEAA